MRLTALLLALLSSTGFAQILVAGHHIGETTVDFLASTPSLQKHLAQCHREDAPKPVSVGEVDAMDLAQMMALFPGEYSVPAKKKVAELARQGKLFYPDTRDAQEKHLCTTFADAFEGHAPLAAYKEGNADFLFIDGKLANITVNLNGLDFDNMAGDMALRVGAAPTLTEPAHQNKFGATWKDREAIWLTPEFTAVLTESREPEAAAMSLNVIGKASMEMFSKRNGTGSPLDGPHFP